MCFIDYDREIALVIESGRQSGPREIYGMGQLTRLHGTIEAEFAILVVDELQRTGLDTELLTRLLDIARDEQIERVVVEILPQNERMRRVCTKLGFKLTRIPQSGVFRAEIEL